MSEGGEPTTASTLNVASVMGKVRAAAPTTPRPAPAAPRLTPDEMAVKRGLNRQALARMLRDESSDTFDAQAHVDLSIIMNSFARSVPPGSFPSGLNPTAQ